MGLLDLLGSTNPAWVYNSSVGLQVERGSPSLAWDYKTTARKEDKHPTLNTAPARSVIKKGGPARAPGPRPGPGPAQRARHTCMGLLDLPGSIRLAWV